MKNTWRLPVLLCSFISVHLISCTSLKELKFANHPDFEKNAEKYLVTSPLTRPSSKPHAFIFEDTQTNDVYEIVVQWSQETSRKGKMDEESLASGSVAFEEDFDAHRVFISNPIDNRDYEVIGKTTISRSLKKHTEKLTEETTVIAYPIEFWIFDGGREVGRIVMPEPSSLTTVAIDVFIHDRRAKLEFQQFNARYISLQYEDDLIAFFELKPEKVFNYKNFKGSVLLKPELSNDFVADVFTAYIVAEIMVRIVAEA